MFVWSKYGCCNCFFFILAVIKRLEKLANVQPTLFELYFVFGFAEDFKCGLRFWI